MATVSSLGIGTGVDLQTMLTKIMAAERSPIDALETKISATNSKISLYGTLKSKLDALQTAAETLQYPSRLSAVTASSSDSAVLGASATFTAAVGSYATEVTQLASAQKSFSTAYTAGTTFGPGGTLDFTVGGVAAASINLDDPAGYTLQDVSTRINSAKIGVTATVITTSNGDQRMVLTGDKSGDGNGFSLSAPGLTVSGGQGSLATFDTSPELKIGVAQNAKMTIDGIEVSSNTNTFSTAVSGLTLTAVKLGVSNVNVQNDSSKITSAVQAFVDGYNSVVSLIKSNSGYNAATKTSQAFSGDFTARSVLGSLGNARTSTPTDLANASIKTLAELGISIQQTGLLTLDSTKLNEAISKAPNDVVSALNAYGKSFSTELSTMLTGSGAVSNRVSSLNASVTRFKDSQAAMELRVGLIEKRYRAQFTALDKFVSSMQTTSTYLGQQLAALQK